MRTQISIPDALFEAAERLAKRLRISRSELYRRALKKYLEDYGHRMVQEKLDRIYAPESVDGRLDPAIEYLQSLPFPEDEW